MPASKPQMDWEAVWKTLNWDDETRDRETEQVRLRQRTQQYAAPLTEDEVSADNAKSILTFQLGQERYGVDVMLVRGVRAVPRITWVPGAPDFYRGVINLRGQIITALDLRLFFGVSVADENEQPGEVVVTHVGRLDLALLAHQITGVVSLTAEEIKPVENLPYALGITADRIVVLNLKALFEDDRLMVGAEK